MTDLEAVVSMAVFEAVNGYSRPTEACQSVKQYVEDNYIKVDSIVLKTIEKMSVRDIVVMAHLLGVCFPVNGGRIAVRGDMVD